MSNERVVKQLLRNALYTHSKQHPAPWEAQVPTKMGWIDEPPHLVLEEILKTDIKGITPALIQAKRRIGQRMVGIYLGVYALYVAIHVFFPAVPGIPCSGVSLGLIGGVAMMLFAVLMALTYHLLCSRAEKRLAPLLKS